MNWSQLSKLTQEKKAKGELDGGGGAMSDALVLAQAPSSALALSLESNNVDPATKASQRDGISSN